MPRLVLLASILAPVATGAITKVSAKEDAFVTQHRSLDHLKALEAQADKEAVALVANTFASKEKTVNDKVNKDVQGLFSSVDDKVDDLVEAVNVGKKADGSHHHSKHLRHKKAKADKKIAMVASKKPEVAVVSTAVATQKSTDKVAAVSAAAATQSATDEAVGQGQTKVVEVDSEGLLASLSAGAAQLHQELAEVRQHRFNVKQLQEALAADVALLRESTTLEKVSVSRRSRANAELQLKKSEQLVKDTSSMLRDTRSEAFSDAQGVLKQVVMLQQALDALKAEAVDQVKLFGAAAAAGPAPAAQKPIPVVQAKTAVAQPKPAVAAEEAKAQPTDSAEDEAEEELSANTPAATAPVAAKVAPSTRAAVSAVAKKGPINKPAAAPAAQKADDKEEEDDLDSDGF